MAGIAGVVKAQNPDVTIVGCQPAQSAVMHASVKAGRVLTLESGPTLSDGTAGGLEADSITLGICQELVDEWVEVEEHEIREALRFVFDHQAQVVEGAAAMAVAAYRKRGLDKPGNHVVIICGRNIDPLQFQEAAFGPR